MTHDVHHMVTELTRAHVVQTEYHTDDGTRWHYTTLQPLLRLLECAEPTSTGGGSNAMGGGGKSQPPSHIEALDTLHHIDRMAAAWIRHLGHDDPSNTIACVTKLGSLYPSAGERERPRIETDIRSWWTQARVVTGIDSPSWRPNNTCPLCAKKGTLRVNRETRNAVCIACRATWREDNVGLLIEHIRVENADPETEESAA